MLNEKQKKRIEYLFTNYQSDIKPLTFYVDRKFHRFPKSLLKEFRDVFDHISRCYDENATDEYIEDNLRKAENHFDRICLDTYKYVSDYKSREFLRWKRKYSKYDLQSIDNGDFWKNILILENEAERIFADARNIEGKNIKLACDMLQESSVQYDKIEEMKDDKLELILKAKFKYIRVTLATSVAGFFIGVASSMLASYLYSIITNR